MKKSQHFRHTCFSRILFTKTTLYYKTIGLNLNLSTELCRKPFHVAEIVPTVHITLQKNLPLSENHTHDPRNTQLLQNDDLFRKTSFINQRITFA
jgi:hypothetical protein